MLLYETDFQPSRSLFTAYSFFNEARNSFHQKEGIFFTCCFLLSLSLSLPQTMSSFSVVIIAGGRLLLPSLNSASLSFHLLPCVSFSLAALVGQDDSFSVRKNVWEEWIFVAIFPSLSFLFFPRENLSCATGNSRQCLPPLLPSF